MAKPTHNISHPWRNALLLYVGGVSTLALLAYGSKATVINMAKPTHNISHPWRNALLLYVGGVSTLALLAYGSKALLSLL